jgi:hypothetical protein
MNTVLKPQHIETIFDHNITDDEFEELFDFLESQPDYEFQLGQSDAYVDLHHLYELRGNEKMAGFYLNKLDEKTKKRVSMRCCIS